MSKNNKHLRVEAYYYGEIPAHKKQRLGSIPSGSIDLEERVMAGCGAYRVLA